MKMAKLRRQVECESFSEREVLLGGEYLLQEAYIATKTSEFLNERTG
tara:strand:+ start:216 stop:356 length:141 start_codon:yes stop_codon:yes gene_type:complete